jgi:hypothetical protein
VWEEAAPLGCPVQVHIGENTPEWRAWQRHLMATTGRGTPVDNRRGWHFHSKLPPLQAEILAFRGHETAGPCFATSSTSPHRGTGVRPHSNIPSTYCHTAPVNEPFTLLPGVG